jgi:ATP-dependent helicase YprA (DUF1998 family)
MKTPTCIDCLKEGVTTVRPTPHGGPRSPLCVTHHRARRRATRARAHERRTAATYGISGEEYWLLYEAQGGRCLICRKGRGISKRLAVDHEHHLCDDHPPENGCPRCVRALLCGRCNSLVGWLDAAALQRAIEMLLYPPARRILAAHRAEQHAQDAC